MNSLTNIRWRWSLIGAVAAEIVLLAVTFAGGWVVYRLAWSFWASFAFYGAAMFRVLLPVSYWAAPKAGVRSVLNGTLIGVVAALIVLPPLMMSATVIPWVEAINEALKVAGGATGGALALRSRRGQMSLVPRPRRSDLSACRGSAVVI